MIEKILLAMRHQIVDMADAERLKLLSLTTDQLNELRHECGNIKPNAPASLRIAATVMDAVAEAILDERKSQ